MRSCSVRIDISKPYPHVCSGFVNPLRADSVDLAYITPVGDVSYKRVGQDARPTGFAGLHSYLDTEKRFWKIDLRSDQAHMVSFFTLGNGRGNLAPTIGHTPHINVNRTYIPVGYLSRSAIHSLDSIRSVDLSARAIAPYKTSRCIETPSLAVKQNFPPSESIGQLPWVDVVMSRLWLWLDARSAGFRTDICFSLKKLRCWSSLF